MDAGPVKELVSRTMRLALDLQEREKNPKASCVSSPRRAPEEIGKSLEGWREETIDERDRDCCSICLDPFTEEDPEKRTTCK